MKQWETTTEEMFNKSKQMIHSGRARQSLAKMLFVGRCYSLEEAAESSGKRRLKKCSISKQMAYSGRASRICYLSRGVIPLKKQQKAVEEDD
ncbi:hypothetical protein CEXT_21051 [Caerostris extrusa]|uniref:Uncharacterized protein n=1 Tax=Caerostris extrusa TaxID=172846 RepID=A0AAV4YEV5_CAEEX|nr:hypothetical protein CEXT_21051 [Caerostris extrusa]